MGWLVLGALFVIASAGLSLREEILSMRRLRSGKGDIDDLCNLTGISNPDELLQLPGVSSGEDGEVTVDPIVIDRAPKTIWKVLLDSPQMDVVNAFCAIVVLAVDYWLSVEIWWLMIALCTYELVGWVWAAWCSWRLISSGG